MFSLQDLLGQDQGTVATDQIASQVGADSSMVNTAIQYALPAILGGLANNASTPSGAESLNNALEQDHSGGDILGNLGGLAGAIFGGQQAPPPRQADAGGILGHILGGSQNAVAEDVSQKSGLGIGQVAQILMMLAPIVMSYLGQQKQQQNVGADGLGGLLGGILGGGQAQAAPQSSGNAMIDMASSMLDSDRDGSAMDDIASMAFNYITKK
ncbi:MAG TPA: DUF937 domain-containing protein [Pyrinomonadaceae bacterium]|nr:DUF937 domain-containing protein [Pyrinomonadaceae bacterium]